MAEINHAMMGGKKDVREMSAWQSSARITYKDPARGTVDLRPATAEEIETNSERIRVAEARRAYLEGGRLEEQQLHTNREIEARARRILTDALHPEDRIAFITSRQGAFLRGVTDGSDWPLLTDAFALLLEDHGWYAEPCSRGLRLTPPADQAGDIVLAGQACVRDAAHTEALEVERLLSGAETWERKHSVFSRPWTVKTVTRNSAAGTVAWAREQGWDTCRTENGELSMESPTGEASYVLRPVADAAPAPVDEKTRRWAEGFAAKWWAEQHTGEPTDDALTAVFAHTVKPPKPEAYPLIREAITALTPPAAAAPLFAAHAAREAVDEAVDLAPSSLHRLVNHLETMPLAAPPRCTRGCARPATPPRARGRPCESLTACPRRTPPAAPHRTPGCRRAPPSWPSSRTPAGCTAPTCRTPPTASAPPRSPTSTLRRPPTRPTPSRAAPRRYASTAAPTRGPG